MQIIVPFFSYPPPNRILYQNGTIIRSSVLMEFPLKTVFFWVPPPVENRQNRPSGLRLSKGPPLYNLQKLQKHRTNSVFMGET